MDKKIQQAQYKLQGNQTNQLQKALAHLETENSRLNKEILQYNQQQKSNDEKLSNYQNQIKLLEIKVKVILEEGELKQASQEEKIEQLQLEKDYFIKEKEQLIQELCNEYQQNEDQISILNQQSSKINLLSTEKQSMTDQWQQKASEFETLQQNYDILSNAYNELQEELEYIKINSSEGQPAVVQTSKPQQYPKKLNELKEQLNNADIFQTDLEKFELQLLSLIEKEFQSEHGNLQNFACKLGELIETNLQHKL